MPFLVSFRIFHRHLGGKISESRLLDILRAMALGADFVMLARPWHYALAALGPTGPEHLTDMLRLDLIANMGQLGTRSLKDVPSRHLVG